jgi:hypothetical protein
LLNDLYDLFLWTYLGNQITNNGCRRIIRTDKNKVRFLSSVGSRSRNKSKSSSSSKTKKSNVGEVEDSGDEADFSGKEEGEISELDGGASNRRQYTRNYRNNYRNNYPNNFLKRDAVRDVSKIGYYISIDLELKKGSPLSPEEMRESKCSRKWNSVRKAFANFTGKTYAIPPVYDYSNKQTLKNRSNNKPNNVTRSNKPPPQGPPKTNVANPTNKTGGVVKKV